MDKKTSNSNQLPSFASWTNRLRLRHLAMLLNISKHPSLTAAAEAMNMSQPAVSQWLNDIENALGVTLYTRGRRLKPTPYAEVLIKHAKVLLGESSRMHEEILAMQKGSSGIVRIGTLLVGSTKLLPATLMRLMKESPNLQFSLIEDLNVNLVTRFENNELDIIIGRIDFLTLTSKYFHEVLLDDQHCVFCGPDHPLTKKRKPTWKDTLSYPWILPPSDTPLRQSIEMNFASHELSYPGPWVESTSISLNMALMRQSDCLAISSTTATQFYKSFGIIKTLPLTLTYLSNSIGMMWRDQTPSPQVQIALEALRTQAKVIRNQ